MAFTYKVVERKNTIPNAKTPRVAVAHAKMLGRVSTNELAMDIADRCTVHRADVKAVLDALSTSAMSFITKGLGVQLGELGSLCIAVRSKSAPTKSEWKPELVKKAVIRYTPGVEMKAKLAQVGFRNIEELVEGKPTAPKAGEESTVDGGNDNKPTNPGETPGGVDDL